MVYVLILIGFLGFFGCRGAQEASIQPVQEQKVVPQIASSFDGTYVFDAEAYQRDQKSYKDSALNEMKAEDIEKMMKIFRPYKVELSGESVTASFAYDVIQGKLVKNETTGSGAAFDMIPQNPGKKSEVVKFIVEGDSLILDPGKNPSDRMNFRKVK